MGRNDVAIGTRTMYQNSEGPMYKAKENVERSIRKDDGHPSREGPRLLVLLWE
jgi:hypothetical protein